MSNTATTDRTHQSEVIYASLGPNERAMIDKVHNSWLRRLFIRFVGIKLQLQFTGWLQYLMPVPITLGLFLLVGLIHLVGLPGLASVLIWLPLILTAIILFDIVTCRFCIRLPEPLPKARSGEDIFTLMRERRSCRAYQTRPLTLAHEQALKARIAMHLQESRLGNAPIRLEWVKAPITVWPVVNARYFLVAIAPAEYNRTAILDVGRTLQKIVLDTTQMGLGTCWIGPGADHRSVKTHLGERFDEEKDSIICLCAIGYKSWYTPLFIRFFNAQLHKRLPLSRLFFADNAMKEALKIDESPWEAFDRCFESCRWAPSSYNGQTTRCIAHKKDTQVRLDFYATTSSRYYAAVATGIWCANWEMGGEALGIKGDFVKLPPQERKIKAGEELPPHYEISWLCETLI
ncbi:nitroreductase family protein [Microbulbifer variabilis]|uniref:nitroreductase family protein n=1 Tax=Microbulbifer variabilis TaxID=266805 RepID=UPI001CFD5EBF|nr:nitroreductase family protein [Microbulbifer variabilis]